MKIIKSISAILFIVAMSMLFCSVTTFAAPVVFAILVALSFIPAPKGVAFMAVQKEIWENDIIGNLFKDNQFANRAVSGDQYVIGGAVVHIPHAGLPSASLKNPTAFPIPVVKRGDSEIVYTLDNYFQPPKLVQNVEQYELSYDKRQSIMGEQQGQIVQDAMDGLLYRWAWQGLNIGVTPGNSILTTGAATAATISGAAGTRKLFTKAAFSSVKLSMDKAKISPNGRVALLTADHYQQFLDSLTDAALTNFYRMADISKGVIGTYLGFDVIMRATTQRWRKVAGVWTPVDEQDVADFIASDQTGDGAGSVFWQQDAVERARGDVSVFDNAGRAEYYGDVFSMNMRLGGRQRRAAGIWAVIEDIAA